MADERSKHTTARRPPAKRTSRRRPAAGATPTTGSADGHASAPQEVADASAGVPTPDAPTGRELAATRAGVNPHTGATQGALVQHPKGSNGGVHRGRTAFRGPT